MPFEQLLLHIRHAGGGQQRGQHVFVRADVVDDGAGLDDAGPADGAGHAIGAFPVARLFVAERRRAAVRPGEFLRAVVGGIHDDGVVLEAEFLELGEHFRRPRHHARPCRRDKRRGRSCPRSCGLRCVQMCMRVAFHQMKNGLSAFFASVMKRSASLVNSSSTRFHALRCRAGRSARSSACRPGWPSYGCMPRVAYFFRISGSLK